MPPYLSKIPFWKWIRLEGGKALRCRRQQKISAQGFSPGESVSIKPALQGRQNDCHYLFGQWACRKQVWPYVTLQSVALTGRGIIFHVFPGLKPWAEIFHAFGMVLTA
jgi:hypothetical protein